MSRFRVLEPLWLILKIHHATISKPTCTLGSQATHLPLGRLSQKAADTAREILPPVEIIVHRSNGLPHMTENSGKLTR